MHGFRAIINLQQDWPYASLKEQRKLMRLCIETDISRPSRLLWDTHRQFGFDYDDQMLVTNRNNVTFRMPCSTTAIKENKFRLRTASLLVVKIYCVLKFQKSKQVHNDR